VVQLIMDTGAKKTSQDDPYYAKEKEKRPAGSGKRARGGKG
jgi:hypothetical protein